MTSARLVCVHWWIRMKVTSEEVDTDHVGQPVGPSVKVEDQTQCCVGHLKVAMWLSLGFLEVLNTWHHFLEFDPPPPHHSLARYTQQYPFPRQPGGFNVTIARVSMEQMKSL